MHRASAESASENCLAPSGRCSFRTIIRASSIGGPMRPIRIASPRIPVPDRTKRAAPCGVSGVALEAALQPPRGRRLGHRVAWQRIVVEADRDISALQGEDAMDHIELGVTLDRAR